METNDEASDSKFGTRKWNVFSMINQMHFSVGNSIINNIEFVKSNLCHYNDACILARGDITIIGHQAA